MTGFDHNSIPDGRTREGRAMRESMKHQDDTNKDLNGCAGCSSENLAGIGRRSFIGALLGTGSLLIGAIVGGPVFRFVFYPVYAKSKSDNWSDVGDIADFEKIDTPIVKTVEFAERDEKFL